MEIKFDFDISEDDDRRPDFRISKCCGTCKYYSGIRSRGYCLHPNVLPKDFSIIFPKTKIGAGRPQHIKFDKKITRKLERTHFSATCSNHIYKRLIQSVNRITQWCGARIQKGFD